MKRPTFRKAATQAVLLLVTVAAPLVQARPAAAAPGDITKYAGGGLGVGPALKVGQQPFGVAVHGTQIYVSDPSFNVVRMVDTTTGLETVIAGTGARGLSGDGGPATQALLNGPVGLAVDSAGDLFIADSGNSLIREVTTDGVIHRFAGTTAGYSGDGRLAINAQLRGPDGVFVDTAGNLFIADTVNWRIREVQKSSGNIVPVAGTSSIPATYPCDPTTLCAPSSVVVDSSGDIFIADRGNGLVRKSDANGNLTTILPDATVTAVTLDGSGNLFAADTGNVQQLVPALVREVVGASATGKVINYAGDRVWPGGGDNGDGGPANAAVLGIPEGLAFDGAGNLLIADDLANRVRTVAPTAGHIINTAIGTGDLCSDADDGSLATSARLCPKPASGALAFDGQGNLLISDLGRAVRRVNGDGTIGTVISVSGASGMAPDGAGGLYVIEYSIQSVLVTIHHIDSHGTDVRPIVHGPAAPVVAPAGAATDASGNLVTSSGRTIVKVAPDGTATTYAGVYYPPFGVTCSGDGGPANLAIFWSPQVLGFDSAGNLFIFDPGAGNTVREIDATGIVRTVAGDGSVNCGSTGAVILGLPHPTMAVNPFGDIYVASGCTVDRVTGSLVATVVTTNGCSGGGLGPFSSIAVDPAGVVYLADSNLVWRMEAFPQPGPALNVQAVGGIGSATVSWQPPASTGGSPIAGYVVAPIQDGSPIAPVTVFGPNTSATVSNLTRHTYTFQVRAINGGAPGPPSAPSSPVMVSWVPAAPLNVTAVAGDGQAIVRWSPPTDDGGLPITAYDVAVLNSPVPVVKVSGATSTLVRGLTNNTTYTFSVAAENAAGPGPPTTSSAVTTVPAVVGGNYRPLPPGRILDTRLTHNPLGPGASLQLRVLGQGGVPLTGVSAVVLNVTATHGTAASDLNVYPSFGSPPATSTLNWHAGQTVPNLTVVGVGRAGSVTLSNAAGWVDAVVDVEGWVGIPLNSASAGSLFVPGGPMRLWDTRVNGGPPQGGGQSLGPQGVLRVPVANGSGGLPQFATAVALNVTVTNPSVASFLTVWPDGDPIPVASNLNFVAGQTVANRVIVPTGGSGYVDIFNAAGQVDVIVDANGWFENQSGASGSRYTALMPHRLFDTRTAGGPLTPDTYLFITFAANVSAVVLNVTVTNPTAPSDLVVWPDDGSGTINPPLASDLNYVPGQTVANLVVVRTGAGGQVDLYNVAGSADVIIDIVGVFGPTYYNYPGNPPPVGYRLVG